MRPRITLLRRFSPWTLVFAHALLLTCCAAFPVMAQPATDETMVARKAWEQTNKQVDDLRTTSPSSAVALLQKFLLEHPQVDENIGIEVYAQMSDMQANLLKTPEAALTTLEEGIKKFSGARPVVKLVMMQSFFLKPAPSEAILLKWWPQLVTASSRGDLSLIWQRLYLVLKEQGKLEESQKVLEVAWRTSPVLMDDRENIRSDWFIEKLVASAMAKGQTAKALSWAKLRFVTCAYADDPLARASQQLATVWSISSPKSSAAFLSALNDAAQPNPLKPVVLPPIEQTRELPFEVPALEDLWERSGPHERISLLLWRGTPLDYSRAMLEAVQLSNDQEPSRAAEGRLEVCRVFKAADLNLTRAQAYLAYLKTGQGTSPVQAFMESNSALIEAAEAKAATAGDGEPK